MKLLLRNALILFGLLMPINANAIARNSIVMLYGYWECGANENDNSGFFGNGGCHYGASGVVTPEIAIQFPVTGHVTSMTCSASADPGCVTTFSLMRDNGFTLIFCTNWNDQVCTSMSTTPEPFTIGQATMIYVKSFPTGSEVCPSDLFVSCALRVSEP